jgi:anti-sigma B factor antagonist
MTTLRVSVEEFGGADVLELAGDAELSTVDEFIQRLLELSASGRARIILDLSLVSFVDSTVVNALLASVARIRRSGGDLVIVCPNPDVRRVFDVTGLEAIFRIVDTRAQAASTLPNPDSADPHP